MIKIIKIFLFLIPVLIYSQELALNNENNFYEFSKVAKSNEKMLIEKFHNRFNEINLNNISQTDNKLIAKGFTNHLVSGFAIVEIRYKVIVMFKENRYKLTLTNFSLKDVNGEIPLEGAKSFKNKWIKKINKKLPEIIKNIENLQTTQDDW